MSRQPEYREQAGALTWWGLRGLAPLIVLYRRARRQRSVIVTVEDGGRVRGALMFAASGAIGNLVVLGESSERQRVWRLLQAAFDRELAGSDQRLVARTPLANRSIIAGLRRRGFVPTAEEHLVTLPLGPCTFSWRATRRPRWRWPRVTPIARLERPARSERAC